VPQLEGSPDLRSLATMAEEAQRSLQDRPSRSIRLRIAIGFVVWFGLSLGLSITSIVILTRIEHKLHFMEAVASYTFEIQQARRFEKNYLLYRTNLDDALEQIGLAQQILDAEHRNIVTVVGENELQRMNEHLEGYRQLLLTLDRREEASASGRAASLDHIESELREHGAQMVQSAQQIMAKERSAVNTMLAVSRRIPLAFLVVLALLMIYLGQFVARQMLAPLSRMMEVTRRVSDGDYTMVRARRKYRDEFSELAMAMNHMMYQLLQRQDLLIRSHKLKAVGTLTAGVAHELNNPINNIMITASLLQEDYTDLPETDRLDMVHDLVSEAERAQRIVRNLLDFARESEVEAQSLNMKDIVEATLRLAANQIKLAKVKVRGEVAQELPPVRGDRQQLEQVLLNLVLNALDAMPGGGTLTITIDRTQDRRFVAVSFRDTGAGIPEQNLGSIFDPFFTTKSKAKGTGLGLSVSLGIIKQHGGDIRVASREGEGSTFTVLLPVAMVPASIHHRDEEARDEDGDEDDEALIT
jgi:two-component system NtrC family sensor kinase